MIKLKKILYPTDFSDPSLEALRYAISFAREYHAKLIVMHVVNEKVFSEGLSLPRIISQETAEQEMTAEAERRLRGIIPAEAREGLDWSMVTLRGNPFLEIIRYAHDESVDLIVIGTHGHSGVEQIFFGSTAEKVVRKAPCPVLTVGPAQRKFVLP